MSLALWIGLAAGALLLGWLLLGMAAFGAGLTWGGALVRWGGPDR